KKQKTSSKSQGKVGPSFPFVVEVEGDGTEVEPTSDVVAMVGVTVQEGARSAKTQGATKLPMEACSSKVKEVTH
ncbi:hypothetical protein PJP08_29315, partial [Mycobacterium kansasii]